MLHGLDRAHLASSKKLYVTHEIMRWKFEKRGLLHTKNYPENSLKSLFFLFSISFFENETIFSHVQFSKLS